MNTVWGSMSIQVPTQMIAETRYGAKLRDTLTRRGNIATNKGVRAFLLSTGGTHTNILDQGTKLNLNNLQSVLKKEKKLFKKRKK
jgi:hypothetical protein